MGCFAALALSLVGIPPSAASSANGIWLWEPWTACPPPVLYHSGGAADLGAFDGSLSVSAAVPRLLSGAGFPGPEPGPGPLLLVLSLALFAAASLILGLLSGITVPVMEHITGSIL